MTTTIEIRPLTQDNMADAKSCDASFVIESELVLDARDGIISYRVRPLPASRKTYAHSEARELAGFIGHPDKGFFLAYIDGKVAGHASISVNWNRLALLDHVEVDRHFRQRGVGRALVAQAIAWAREKRLPGVMLETQNNNVAACRLYEACGFTLGGFDRFLYQGDMPDTREIALYWYLMLTRD
ncbi:MAG: GNAT family N-acetyltransferase [Parvibaculaceae bacterium]